MVEADRARVWRESGARNAADWLASKSKTSYADAARQMKLGDSMERNSTLAAALDTGEISAATEDALHPALAAPPEGADPDELVDSVKGAGPKDALDAVEKWKAIHSAETPEQRRQRVYQARSVRAGKPEHAVRTSAPCPASRLTRGSWRPRPHDRSSSSLEVFLQ